MRDAREGGLELLGSQLPSHFPIFPLKCLDFQAYNAHGSRIEFLSKTACFHQPQCLSSSGVCIKNQKWILILGEKEEGNYTSSHLATNSQSHFTSLMPTKRQQVAHILKDFQNMHFLKCANKSCMCFPEHKQILRYAWAAGRLDVWRSNVLAVEFSKNILKACYDYGNRKIRNSIPRKVVA